MLQIDFHFMSGPNQVPMASENFYRKSQYLGEDASSYTSCPYPFSVSQYKREWKEEENLYLAARAPIKKLILIEVRHASICQYTSQTPRGFMGIAMYT